MTVILSDFKQNPKVSTKYSKDPKMKRQENSFGGIRADGQTDEQT